MENKKPYSESEPFRHDVEYLREYTRRNHKRTEEGERLFNEYKNKKRKDKYGKVLVGSRESWVRLIDENFDNSMGDYNYLFFNFIDENGLAEKFDEFLAEFVKEVGYEDDE